MSGAIPPLPQYAFMAWCSVKAQGQLYLYLYLYLYFTRWRPVVSFTPHCQFYIDRVRGGRVTGDDLGKRGRDLLGGKGKAVPVP
jgi:hypothetical protein